MSEPTEADGARPSPLPVEGVAAKRPPRRLSPNALAARAHQVASSDEPVEIKEGTLIGDYSVQRRLDEGGMGTVYSAVHPVIGKRVAIKVLHPHVARQEEAVARFIQEARAVNAIGHPGIVDVFGFGRFVDGRHYITMEYLEGQQLLAYLNQHGPIPPLDVVPLAFQLAESLAAAHDKGVVHRDMKPENVFLGVKPGEKSHHPWPPRTKILDFGLAKLIEAEFSDRKPRTRAGVTVGTPYYMSPEQCRGKAIDRRADIYALGVMMYEMLTGRVPFYAAESVDVLYMHLTQEPEAPSSHRPVPVEIEALVLRCMAKAIAERPQTMYELMAELDAVTAKLVPSDAAIERPEHVLLQEAEAFFGGGDDLPSGASPKPVIHSVAKDRITKPMSVEGMVVPAEALPGDPVGSGAGSKADPGLEPEPGIPDEPGAPTEKDMAVIPARSVRTFSEPAGHGVPSLPTPDAPREAAPEPALEVVPEPVSGSAPEPVSGSASEPAPEALPAAFPEPAPAAIPEPVDRYAGTQVLSEELLLRPAHGSKSPALDGFETAVTAVPAKLRPRQRALWAAVAALGVAVVVLAVLLMVGPRPKPPTAAGAAVQEVDMGSVELSSPVPVDVFLDGRSLARNVRRIVVARLPAGSTQVFVIKRSDGSEHRATVRVAAARTISVTVPPH